MKLPRSTGQSDQSLPTASGMYVSSTHARFTIQGPALVLEDLDSTNGTLVNGRLIDQPVTLRDNDEVQIGDVVMRVSRR